jgi:Domain of unknown function DUF29
MEEILQLKEYLVEHRYEDAMLLVGEMEEMARSDKLNTIRSYMAVLLAHCIKQEIEQRTTRSWDVSIRNAVIEIAYINKRPNSGGFYAEAEAETLEILLNRALESALNKAASEIHKGKYTPEEVAELIDTEALLHRALTMILDKQRILK